MGAFTALLLAAIAAAVQPAGASPRGGQTSARAEVTVEIIRAELIRADLRAGGIPEGACRRVRPVASGGGMLIEFN